MNANKKQLIRDREEKIRLLKDLQAFIPITQEARLALCNVLKTIEDQAVERLIGLNVLAYPNDKAVILTACEQAKKLCLESLRQDIQDVDKRVEQLQVDVARLNVEISKLEAQGQRDLL